MNLTPDQLTDILQEVGIAFRHDHPSAVHQGEPGIYYGFDNPDIDLTERIAKAAELINAQLLVSNLEIVPSTTQGDTP